MTKPTKKKSPRGGVSASRTAEEAVKRATGRKRGLPNAAAAKKVKAYWSGRMTALGPLLASR